MYYDMFCGLIHSLSWKMLNTYSVLGYYVLHLSSSTGV